MKAYKCDICYNYCDNVYCIDGIYNPETNEKYKHVNGTNMDCCESCHDKIMYTILNMMKESEVQNDD